MMTINEVILVNPMTDKAIHEIHISTVGSMNLIIHGGFEAKKGLILLKGHHGSSILQIRYEPCFDYSFYIQAKGS